MTDFYNEQEAFEAAFTPANERPDPKRQAVTRHQILRCVQNACAAHLTQGECEEYITALLDNPVRKVGIHAAVRYLALDRKHKQLYQ